MVCSSVPLMGNGGPLAIIGYPLWTSDAGRPSGPLLLFNPNSMKSLSHKNTVSFYLISIVAAYFVANGFFTYLLQDSSPKQATALLQLLVYIIAIAVSYLIYFKVTEIKFKQIVDNIQHPSDKHHKILNIAGIVVILVVLGWEYRIYHLTDLAQGYARLQEAIDMLNNFSY